MKIKKEINLFAGMFTAEEIYRYGDIILLLGHIIYLVLFYQFGVYQMVYYNYFSVAFYAVMYFLLHFKKIGKISFTYLVLGEIIVHACMGAYYIGWSAGFTQIMLCIIPIPFFISQNRKAIPYILSSFDVVVFIVMRIIVTNRVAPYSFDTNRENILYIYNTLCSFIIIIYVSSIYIFTNEHNKREAKAQNEKLQKLATIDPLTQLFNRRAMMDFIKKIESNSRRTNSVITKLTKKDANERTVFTSPLFAPASVASTINTITAITSQFIESHLSFFSQLQNPYHAKSNSLSCHICSGRACA